MKASNSNIETSIKGAFALRPGLMSEIHGHPLICGVGESGILTAPVADLLCVILSTIRKDVSRYDVECKPRDGASFAAVAMTEKLRAEFSERSVYFHSVPSIQLDAGQSFSRLLISSLGISDFAGSNGAIRSRLTSAFLDGLEGEKAEIHLVIDGANSLTKRNLVELDLLGEDLEREGAKLKVVLFKSGTMEPPPRLRCASELENDSDHSTTRLRSHRDLADIQWLLQQLDIVKGDDGKEHTQFFLPKAYRNGYRLITEANSFFDALCRTRQRGDSCHRADFIFAALRRFLIWARANDSATFASAEDVWRWAVSR